MLPGITQVHVEAHRSHEAALVVIDAAPVGFDAIFLVGSVKWIVHPSWHLIPLVQVENRMEDRVVVLNLHDRPVRKYTAHAGGEDLPFPGAMKSVAHEESAAEQVLAQLLRLRVGQIPVADLDAV